MNQRAKVLSALLCLLPLAGCGVLSPLFEREDPSATAARAYLESNALHDDLRTHAYVLASDSLRGREAGTPGERSAAEYIARALHDAGLKPAAVSNGDTSFFQPFQLHSVAFDTLHTRLHVEGLGQTVIGRDWISFPDHSPVTMMDSVGIVFAGYGVAAPLEGYDDYAGIDPLGKVVVAVSGAPPGLDSVRTYAGRFAAEDFQIKWVSAAQRGAAALIVVGEHQALSQWTDYATLARSSSMSLPDSTSYTPVMPYVFASEAFGSTLLSHLGLNGANTPGASLDPFLTEHYMDLHLVPRRSEATSQNVLGYLAGSQAGAGYVVVGAHYDHLGTSDGEVFSGADDNASGVAVALGAARALSIASDGRPLDRSVVIVFHGAEEKGLLGARYATEHPEESVFGSMDEVVAFVNLDMVGREHPDSLYVVGGYRMSTELGRLVDSINESLGDDNGLFHLDPVFNDPEDPERIFERSDHFRYAVHGVPVVFFSDGMGSNWRKGGPTDDYHRVTDVPEKLNLDKMARVTRLVYELTRAAADADRHFPIDGQIPAVN